jgi:hypothetical protein
MIIVMIILIMIIAMGTTKSYTNITPSLPFIYYLSNYLSIYLDDDTYNLLLILNNLGQCYREMGQLQLSLDVFSSALNNITEYKRYVDNLLLFIMRLYVKTSTELMTIEL